MIRRLLLTLAFLLISPTSVLASTTYSSVGTYNFIVPFYTGNFTVDVNGEVGGGGGGSLITTNSGNGYVYAGYPGAGGGQTSIPTLNLTANSGGGGGGGTAAGACSTPGNPGSASGPAGSSVVIGGGTTGGLGGNGAGGNNGNYLYSYTSPCWVVGAPGGAGGKVSRSYTSAQLVPGTTLNINLTANSGGGAGWDAFYPTLHADAGASSVGSVVLTWVDRPNNAPLAPTITGPVTAFTQVANSFTVQSTDPDGDLLRYAFDWDNNGVADEYAPAGFSSPSGSPYVRTHSWPSVGTYTFKVQAQDASAASPWTSYTVVIGTPTSQAIVCDNQLYSYPGPNTYPLIVPATFWQIQAEVYGGGGGGNGLYKSGFPNYNAGSDGGQSSFNGTLIANGGGGATTTSSSGGLGGTASGGDINQTGVIGGYKFPNTTYYGGSSGTSTSIVIGGKNYFPAAAASPTGPGAGGGGYNNGGGGAGYAKKIYTPATLTPNSSVTAVAAAPGAGGPAPVNSSKGGAGGVGQINIRCTTGPTTGYLYANGQPNQLYVDSGDNATLTWQTVNAKTNTCSVYKGTAPTQPYTADNNLVGSSTGAITADRSYFLKCQDWFGNTAILSSVNIIKNSVTPIVQLSALSSRVRRAGTTTLSWNVQNLNASTTCAIAPAFAPGVASWDGVGTSWVGSAATDVIMGSTKFTLTCNGPAGIQNASTNVNLVPSYTEI